MKRYLNFQKGNPAKLRFVGIFILQFLCFNSFAQITVDKTDVTCTGAADGTATVTSVSNGTAPYTYLWSNGQTTAGITDLDEGTYSVTVTDANSCTGTESVDIEVSMDALQTTQSSTPESCEGTADGSASVTASGGHAPYTYTWSNGGSSASISDLSAGTYTVTVEDANGCHGSESVTVEVSLNAFPVTITSSEDPSCHGYSDGTATASASGGQDPYTYTWSNGSSGATASGLAAGSYTVTAKDADGCYGNTSVSLTDPSELTVSIGGGGASITYCAGTTPPSVTLSASASGGTPPYNLSWPGGSITVSGSGSYCCSATDSKGCSASGCAEVVIIPIDCPKDPNIIAGPEGYAEEHWVSVKDQLAYTVWFENDPVFATAPAQEVKVTVPISNKIAMNSLRVGSFGFGDNIFSVPSNTSYYTKRLDVTSTLGVYVDIIAGLDVIKKEAFWTFRSIDPATGLPPNDAQTGFLPVNDTNTHVGEGFISFTIQPKASDVTGDSILAQAKIIFDINESISTNVWFNVVDAVPPTSSVDSLPPFNPTSLDINFSGQDDPGGCGLNKYQLYFSKNSGPYNLFGEYNANDTAHLNGIESSGYRFFSIAVDHVGNTEPMKNIPDISTIIGLPGTITGTVTYQNNMNTPIKNAWVYLRNTNGIMLDSVNTDVNGNYDFGLKLRKTYLADGFADQPWGGVNSTDALLVRRASIGLSALNRLQDTAADVNHSNTISSTDALQIRRRIVGQIDNFQMPDWVFLKDTIVVADSLATHSIKTLCAGDVNGSYAPVMLKSSGMSLVKKGDIYVNRNQDIDLPIICENSIQPAAITLLIDYPEKFVEVGSISSSLPGFLYSAKKGKVIIAWDSLSPATFNNNDVLCVLHLRVNDEATEKDNIALSLDAGCEFANKTAEVINDVSLSYPDVRISPYLDFELSQNHPNPFGGETEIGYVLPEEGNVLIKAYDVLGQEIETMVSSVQKAGKYSINFDGAGLRGGAYYYKITVEGVTRNFNATRSMIIFPK